MSVQQECTIFDSSANVHICISLGKMPYLGWVVKKLVYLNPVLWLGKIQAAKIHVKKLVNLNFTAPITL